MSKISVPIDTINKKVCQKSPSPLTPIDIGIITKSIAYTLIWGVFMIVISKKRLILIVSMVCISLTAFMCRDMITNTDTVPTVNLPVSNKVIVLDAGHRSSR